MEHFSRRLNRRDLLKFGSAILIGGVADLRPAFGQDHLSCPKEPELSPCGDLVVEYYPTSPFILNPFSDPLPIPPPLRPTSLAELLDGGRPAPGPGMGQQASDYHPFSTHQIWPTDRGLPDPVTHGRVYRIKLEVAPHYFTTSKVQPIDMFGNYVMPPDGIGGPRYLPASTIWGFNGQFPGPMINAEYGKPVVVRFENHLDEEDYGLDSGDFGSPCRQFLTHLHNGHTAPESDGNPHFRPHGYFPHEWVDNLYLNYPPSGDDREKQSFLWFHDHFEGYTGANVYKGLVGLYPIYDPKLDPGDERATGMALRLPGIRTDHADGTFAVEYDIPLAFYDCALDDGVTPHKDFHNGCGETQPQSWGKTFFRHYPDRGFVGDIFTVNGKAYPVLQVKRRKYRFRLLDASIARVYDFMLMTSSNGPKPAPGTQGQWTLRDGEQCMKFTQIASEGGLLPFPIVRNSIQMWPAKRREVVVDFSRYLDGNPTTKGDVIYLVNCLAMPDGRKQEGKTPQESDCRVPVMKIVIGDDAADTSVVPQSLRPLPPIDMTVPRRTFDLERGGVSGGDTKNHPLLREVEWLINGRPFNPEVALAYPKQAYAEIWRIRNDGGGWVHPMHFHQEEHQVLSRNGVTIPRDGSSRARFADDIGKEDTIALNPNDEVVIYRNFRTFQGPYVAHCHNLAHEDHSMMFGWTIVKA